MVEIGDSSVSGYPQIGVLFQDELKTETRKKNILILVLNYLNEEGWVASPFTIWNEQRKTVQGQV